MLITSLCLMQGVLYELLIELKFLVLFIFVFSYSYVRQTKLAGSLADTRIAHASQNRTCPHGTSAKPARAPRGTLRNSRSRSLPRPPLQIPTPLKLSLLASAPACPRLRPRCFCYCRPAAVGTPHERRQNG